MRSIAMSRWLGGLEPDALAGILLRRPEANTAPVPRTLGDLAGRLSRANYVMEAIDGLCAPALQVIEAANALLHSGDDSVDRAALADLLGRAADDTEFDAALEVLYQRALAWPDGDRVVLAGPLRSPMPTELALGRPAAILLERRTVEDVRRIGTQVGCRMAGRAKHDAVATVAARLGDAEFVRDLVATAPPELGEKLADMAGHAPVTVAAYGGYLPDHLRWAFDRGLLVAEHWSIAEMPREVSLALRGPGWHAPFDPRPPLPPSAVPSAEAVRRDAAAAVTVVLDGVAAAIEAAPIARLKSDGVGVREMQRLARGRPEGQPGVGLWLSLAGWAGLLTTTFDGYLATPEYDVWAAEAPAERLATLIEAWRDLPSLVRTTPLRTDWGSERWPRLRRRLLTVLAELHGALPVDGSLVYPLLRWHIPRVLPPEPEAAETAASMLWTEMTLLGLVARGVLSPLGRALADGSDLVAAASGLVAAPEHRAVFQADLTAVVTGPPALELNRLLDGSADREARGSASVWRFTPSSIRRALDAGTAPDDLLARLRSVGTVPQALEYLVRDVARRHGALRVRTAGCVLRSGDQALVAEVAADRRLLALELRVVAPTVLVSARPLAETLAALRRAGYAPVGEDADGTLLTEVPPQRRAEPRVAVRRTPREPVPVRPADAATLAALLLEAPETAEPVVPAELSLPELVTAVAPQLDASEVELLIKALDTADVVRIGYLSKDGQYSERVIEPIDLEDDKLLRAWCHLRDDERVFSLARIMSVSTA